MQTDCCFTVAVALMYTRLVCGGRRASVVHAASDIGHGSRSVDLHEAVSSMQVHSRVRTASVPECGQQVCPSADSKRAMEPQDTISSQSFCWSAAPLTLPASPSGTGGAHQRRCLRASSQSPVVVGVGCRASESNDRSVCVSSKGSCCTSRYCCIVPGPKQRKGE